MKIAARAPHLESSAIRPPHAQPESGMGLDPGGGVARRGAPHG